MSSKLGQADTNREFYDLEDLQLNLIAANGSMNTSWGNLGYWKDLNITESSTNYAQACEQLARELAQVAELGTLNSEEFNAVLDTGFGCGDQLKLWLESYSIQNLYGINLSVSQTEMAHQLVSSMRVLADVSVHLKTGDSCSPESWQNLPPNVSRILALDCLYHFQDKAQYFKLCKRHLSERGVLAVSDLVLDQPMKNVFHKYLLKLICRFSHIPYKNLKSIKDYQSELNALGLQVSLSKDITADVFLPFGKWLKVFIDDVSKHGHTGKKRNWLKYKGTAQFLKWLWENKILSYQILKIEHLTHSPSDG